MFSSAGCFSANLLLLVCALSLCVDGYSLDYQDSMNDNQGSIPRSNFLQSFIRKLRSNDLDSEVNLRTLVPRNYNTGRYEGIFNKRDYGINPPFHELCRMLNMPYCAYRS